MFRHGFTCAIACAVATISTTASADDLLRLWGIDADDAQVFAIDDLRNPHASFNDYGRLHVAGDKAAEPIDAPIRALTIVNTFEAYVVVDDDLAGFEAPVLLTFDLRDIDNALPVVADAIGTIDTPGEGWNVTGIAGDPLFGVMHVLYADGDEETYDRLARVRTTQDKGPQTEHVAEIRWSRGGVRNGADVAMGPAGLLLVGDEADGRVVMIDPTTGQVRGVRIDGIRVDTDTAQYAGIAWDGYNDRTALYDRRTGQLIVTSRRDNSIAAFDMRDTGVVDAEGLEFVYRPDPPGEGPVSSSRAARAITNVNDESHGSRRGIMSSPGGNRITQPSPDDLLDSLDDPSEPPPENDTDPTDDPADEIDPAGDGGPDPIGDLSDDDFAEDPQTDPPGDEPGGGGGGGGGGGSDIPTPGTIAVLGLGCSAVARRRRR